ncbi:MAG TPA: hypothetical protein V6D26_13060 [Stenomitos sp.]
MQYLVVIVSSNLELTIVKSHSENTELANGFKSLASFQTEAEARSFIEGFKCGANYSFIDPIPTFTEEQWDWIRRHSFI